MNDHLTEKHLIPPDIAAYVTGLTRDPHPYLSTLRAEAQAHKWNFMLTTKDQAAALFLHARLVQATKILELGTYFGHSSIAMASALPNHGILTTVEHNPKFAREARRHFEAAGLSEKIHIIVDEALPALTRMEATEGHDSFDLIFVDADKRRALIYWEAGLRLVRPGGLLIFDNVLARGTVADLHIDAKSHVEAVRQFNQVALSDTRVTSILAPIGDGMVIAMKHHP